MKIYAICHDGDIELHLRRPSRKREMTSEGMKGHWSFADAPLEVDEEFTHLLCGKMIKKEDHAYELKLVITGKTIPFKQESRKPEQKKSAEGSPSVQA